MSVYKRGKVYVMDFVVNGVRTVKSCRTSSKKEAVYIAAMERKKVISQINTTPQQNSSRRLLHHAVEQTYNHKWKNNKDGMGSYRRARLLQDHIGNIPLSAITPDVVDSLIIKLESTGIESSTQNRYLATLKTILKHHRLPADFIKLKREKAGRIRVITKDEEFRIVTLLKGAESNGKKSYYTEMASLVIVLLDTGMRLSEALNLNYDDISFDNNLISIWINKGDKPRSIPMTKRVYSILQTIKETDPVKPFRISKHEAERAWQWTKAEMGLDKDGEFCIHALRHTCASRLVNAGVDLYVVKEILGHSSIQITERYAHLNPAKLANAVNKLE